MNNNLFSAIVVAMNELNDVQGAKLLSIINGMVSEDAPKSSTSTSKPVSKPKKYSPAKDATVEMVVSKNTVSFKAYNPKDVWEVLKRRYEALGGTYDKTVKIITFKTQKDAKAFASNNVVKAGERENIRKEWNEKA